MAVLFTNNATTTLASGITSGATSISVAVATGALFPNPTGGDFFYATLVDASNNIEIVKVTARATDVMTVVRAQEGTTARAYAGGDKFELRPTAAGLNSKFDKTGGTLTGSTTIQANSASLTLAHTGTGASSAVVYNDGTLVMRAGSSSQNVAYSGGGHLWSRYDFTNTMTLDNTGNLALNLNNVGLFFKDAAGTQPYFICQSDNNFVFYGTSASGVQQGIWSVAQRATNPTFNLAVVARGIAPSAADNSDKIPTTAWVTTAFAPKASAVLTGNPTADGNLIGYRNLPTSRTISSNTTLADSDKGMKIVWTGGTGSITLNPNSTTAIDVDAVGTIINVGTGNLTIVRGGGVSAKLIGTGTDADRTIPPGCVATWLKYGADQFLVGGANVS